MLEDFHHASCQGTRRTGTSTKWHSGAATTPSCSSTFHAWWLQLPLFLSANMGCSGGRVLDMISKAFAFRRRPRVLRQRTGSKNSCQSTQILTLAHAEYMRLRAAMPGPDASPDASMNSKRGPQASKSFFLNAVQTPQGSESCNTSPKMDR